MTVHSRGTPRRILVAVLAIATATSLPAFAQQAANAPPSAGYGGDYQKPTPEDGYAQIATSFNEQRGEAYRRKDPAAVAAMYEPNATFVELSPRLQVMQSRPEIQRHFEELLEARASDLAFTIVSAEMTGNDTMSVGGDYVLTAKGNKQINGHFFQVLQHDRGTWKIAMEAFSRPEPVTMGEQNDFRGN